MRNRPKRVLGVLIGAIFLTFILIHTPPAKELFRRLLIRSALSFFGGELTLERIDYRLWRGEIRFEQFHWVPKAELAPLALDSSEVEVRFSPVGGVSIFLASPELTVFQPEGQEETSESDALEANTLRLAQPSSGNRRDCACSRNFGRTLARNELDPPFIDIG